MLYAAHRARAGSESKIVSRSPHSPLLEQKPVNSVLCCLAIERDIPPPQKKKETLKAKGGKACGSSLSPQTSSLHSLGAALYLCPSWKHKRANRSADLTRCLKASDLHSLFLPSPTRPPLPFSTLTASQSDANWKFQLW